MGQTTTTIGSRLRAARHHRGLTLRDISNTTKISMTALEAIERNDFARLSKGPFRKAYLRAFAAEVGMDPDEIAREYRAQFGTDAPVEPLALRVFEGQEPESRRWPAAVVVVAGLTSLVLGWLISTRASVSEEAPAAAWIIQPAVASRPESVASAIAVDSMEDVTGGGPAAARAADSALRLDLRAHESCWVQATADGERVVYRLMEAGDHTVIEADSTITLRVGDAAAIVYSINGAVGRPLGRKGEVVTIRITDDNYGDLHLDPPGPVTPGAAST